VLEEIFLNQDAQRVCVGDPAQQIYAWRSARDVMTGFPAEHLELTRSFRFGSPIAEVANRWLRHAESDMRLTGSGPAASQVGVVAMADAVLCRGNADVIKEIMAFLDAGVRVALTGGGEALFRIAEAAQQLKAGHRTSHPELFLFSSWGEVQEYVENDDAAQDLRAFVRLVDVHGPETIMEAMRRLCLEDAAQVTVSTAHKAKGREWDTSASDRASGLRRSMTMAGSAPCIPKKPA
jgi:superfamily I DNA/RNA helicase